MLLGNTYFFVLDPRAGSLEYMCDFDATAPYHISHPRGYDVDVWSCANNSHEKNRVNVGEKAQSWLSEHGLKIESLIIEAGL